jgi:hypothetical protein
LIAAAIAIKGIGNGKSDARRVGATASRISRSGKTEIP